MTCHFLLVILARQGEIREEEAGKKTHKGPRRVKCLLLTPRNMQTSEPAQDQPLRTPAPHPRGSNGPPKAQGQ